MAAPEQEALDSSVEEFIALGAVKEVTPDFPRVSLPLFTVTKKGGGIRGVVNARPVNSYVRCEHFKMEGLSTLSHLLKEKDLMMVFDLSKAYLHLPLAPETSRYLAFQWRGKSWAFTSLPFGLNVAPRVWTKVMKGPLRELRSRGVRCSLYIDDLLQAAREKTLSWVQATFTVLLFTALHLTINFDKVSDKPRTSVEHLGVIVDTQAMMFRVPAEKITRILTQLRGILGNPKDPLRIRDLAALIGRLSSFREAILPTHLFLFYLHGDLIRAKRSQGWEGTVVLSAAGLSDLTWWVENLRSVNGRLFAPMQPSAILQTDASPLAWGAILRKGEEYMETRGPWSAEEREVFSICPMELEAGIRAIEAWETPLTGARILWRSDNSAVVFSVRRWKSMSPQMNAGLRRLWELTHRLNIRIITEHLPGADNHRPDLLSRWLDPEDWSINPILFGKISRFLGRCDVDAFATRANHLCDRWWSRFREPGAEAVDAFAQNFNTARCWCNPPFSRLLELFHLLSRQRATAVVCVPQWEGATWWPVMLEMLIRPPLLLPQREDLFLPASRANVTSVGPAPWPAWVVKVSGHPLKKARAHAKFGMTLHQPSDLLLQWDTRWRQPPPPT